MATMCEEIFNLQSVFESSNCHKTLKPLDDVLRCRICFEYFNDCMITKCSHNYCSICIRRYMMYKAQCPTCFQDASEPELRNNRLIDEIVRIYLKTREDLENCLYSDCKPEVSEKSTNIKQESSIHMGDSSKREKTKLKTSDLKENEVSCPVCYAMVHEDHINFHLDSCLKVKERETDKKYLSKLVYHLMSDKDIKKKLKGHGLNTAGDRKTLIKRHKNFITLYNANADSLKPKPVEELIYEIEKQELEERLSSIAKQPQVNKKMHADEIGKQNESYVREYQSQFNTLIEDVQKRDLSNKIIVKQEQEPEKHAGADPNEPSTLKKIQVKQEPQSPSSINQNSFSKICLEREEPHNKESPLDHEIGKIPLSILRKRKKGRIGTEKPGSPKRK